MTDLPPPRALLFDWDNTLVDTWAVIHQALDVTFRALDREPWTLEQTRQRVRTSAREAFPLLFGERWQEANDIFYATYEEIHMERLRPLPGAEALLTDLAGRGHYLAVISNKTGRYLRDEAAALGWDVHFARLVGATDAARDKPAPDVVHLALDGSGIAPGPDVWFVGDTDIDMRCAADNGLTPVLVRAEAPADDEFPGHRPVLAVPDCAALMAAVAERAVA